MHIVEANACGAHGVSAEEEDRIATWFGDAYELAVTRTGGAKPQLSGDEERNVNPAAAAIWHLLAADLAGGASTEPRCFAVDAVPCPGDPGHLQWPDLWLDGSAWLRLPRATGRSPRAPRRLDPLKSSAIERPSRGIRRALAEPAFRSSARWCQVV
jgi:hypothetical protein